MEDFLSIKEFANLLKVHENTVRRSIKNGRIHAVRVGIGKRSPMRIPKSEINRLAIMDWEKIIHGIIDNKLMND